MILITGANGFIGSVLLADLYQKGYRNLIANDVVDMNVRPHLIQKNHIHSFVHANDLPQFLNSPESQNLQCVFHLGAISSTTETNWPLLVQNNIELSKKLFLFCQKIKIPFIYASSGAVYGDGTKGFSDQVPAANFMPLNLYGKSKADFDAWTIQNRHSQSPWIGLRFFNVYGPNEYHKGEMSSIVYKAYQQIKETGRLKLFRSHRSDYGDGMQKRDFVYVKDISRWMIEIFENKSFASGIYNLGFGKARTWLDLAQEIFSAMKIPMQIDWLDIPEHIRNQYQYFTEADMRKSLAQGLSRPQFSIESGVADYISNHLIKTDPYYSGA